MSSMGELKDLLIARGGFNTTPTPESLIVLKNAINDMKDYRTANTCVSHDGTHYSGKLSVEDLDDEAASLAPCACNADSNLACSCDNRIACLCEARTSGDACTCNTACVCNSDVAYATCSCDYRNNATPPCECDSRTSYTCSCNNRTCDCQSRTGLVGCECDARTGECDCQAECSCNSERRFA